MKDTRRILYLIAILLVTLIALILRLRAADILAIEVDEVAYMQSAQSYAAAFKNRSIKEVIHNNINHEHPPLAKLIYALAILPLEESVYNPELAEDFLPSQTPLAAHFKAVRSTSAILASLGVLVLALLNPLAGFFYAIHAWQVNYTSRVLLESLPSLTSILAVALYLKSKQKMNVWLFLSSVSFGLTAASKYPYCVVGVAIIADWLWKTRPRETPLTLSSLVRWICPVAAWGGISIAVFFAANPSLWIDPTSRLKASLLYWLNFTQSDHVHKYSYPFWQPFVWLFVEKPHSPGAFLIYLDLYIALLAVLGFHRLWRKQRVFALWLVAGLTMLLVWSTKWPQYILILTAPLSVSAAEGFQDFLFEPLKRRLN